jgi:hypothetical protein
MGGIMGKRKSAGLIYRAVEASAKRIIPPEHRKDAIAKIGGMVEERLISMSTPLPRAVAESLAMLLSRMGYSECRIVSIPTAMDDYAVIFRCKERCAEEHCVPNADVYDRMMHALAGETRDNGGPEMLHKTHGDLYTYWEVPVPVVE